MSRSLFQRTRFNWAAMLKMTKIDLEIISGPDL